MTGALSRWIPRPKLRLAALTGLLALALALSALLAWRAVSSERRQRALVQQTLSDYADLAAFVIATGVYREYGIRVLATFGALSPWQTPSLFQRAGADLGCGPTGVYFEYDPGTAALRHGPGPVPDSSLARLADTLQHAAALFSEVKWRFRYIRLDLGDAGGGVFIVPASKAGGFGVRGLSSCLWGDSTFTGLVGRLRALPPTLTGDTQPESLYTVTIRDRNGGTLFASSPWYTSDQMGAAPLGPEFGDLQVGVALNPITAPALLIGGTPPSRVPVALGLFALSAILLAAAVAQLRREYQLIDARAGFVSSVSHELRTPLSQILIFTELLKFGRLRSDTDRIRALDIVDKETRRLIRLVENILAFSGAPTLPPLHLEAVPLRAFAGETVEAFRPLAEARGATLELDIPGDLAATAERHALRQVLVNLLDNAVKYGPEGQTVRVEGTARGSEVELAVEDQGPGVPAADRQRVWDGFVRLDREDNGATGSGIGLSVVRSLVERMGGAAAVTESSTGGARFTVRLPRAGDGAP